MSTLRRCLLATALSVCTVLPLAAQEIVYARALPTASFADLARLDLPPQAPRVRAHKSLPPLRPGIARTTDYAPLPVPAAEASIAPPPYQLAFTSGTSRQLSPADASGAVGRTHVVGAYNAGLVMHDRGGNIVGSATLRQFWATSQLVGDQYDPRIAYDPQNDRWIVMAVDREEALLFAVSESGDPTGTWKRYEVTFGPFDYVDFTRIAVTRDTVVLATCIGTAEYNETSVLLSINKSDLYGTASPMPMRKHEFHGNPEVVPVQGETSPVEYVVTLDFPDIRVGRLDQPNTWRRVGGPSWIQHATFILPQLATGAVLDAGFARVEAAAFRNGSIYAVTTVGGDSGATHSGIAWARINPETLASTWGLVHDPEGKIHYAYPSIAVNANGAMLIGFGTFSHLQYPSAAYVYGDVLGRTSTPVTIRSGDSAVVITDRWGDYTTTVTDPLEPGTFWTVQICSNQNTWGTVWAKVEQPLGRRRSVRH